MQTECFPAIGTVTHRKSAAFTLIELLVVIAIIAILAAILFPVFAQARSKARQTACLSNTKQLGTATMLYVQDYDETYPPSMYDTGTTGTQGRVFRNRRYAFELIASYVKADQLMVCPSANNPDAITFAQTPALASVLPLTYGLNMDRHVNTDSPNIAGSPDLWVRAAMWGNSDALITTPAETILLSDSTAIFVSSNRAIQPQWSGNAQGFAWGMSTAADRHNGGVNITWADGHAKWQKVDSTNCILIARGATVDRCTTYDNGGYKFLTQDPVSGKSYYFQMDKTGIAKPN
jgi:prepilin-type N-terminal cleavage/methylation domain-containing protein/prepilin-type processing-associated H-X9-DG protein